MMHSLIFPHVQTQSESSIFMYIVILLWFMFPREIPFVQIFTCLNISVSKALRRRKCHNKLISISQIKKEFQKCYKFTFKKIFLFKNATLALFVPCEGCKKSPRTFNQRCYILFSKPCRIDIVISDT
jgi:hypothetical protein